MAASASANGGIDLRRKRLVDAKLAGQGRQESMLLLALDIDGDARGGVNLDRLFGRGDFAGEVGGGSWALDLLHPKPLGLGRGASLPQAAQDPLALLRIGASVGGRGGNHGADQQACSLIAERTGLEARTRRCQRQPLLLIGRARAGERRPALLIILVRLVGKVADDGETT